MAVAAEGQPVPIKIASSKDDTQIAAHPSKNNLTCMHNLLDSLIRGTSYLHEEEESDDDLLEAMNRKDEQNANNGNVPVDPTKEALEAADDKKNESLRTRKHFSDYFIQLHQSRAKEASEKEKWEEAESELLLAEMEHQRQMRRQKRSSGLRGFPISLETIRSRSSASIFAPAGEPGESALRRMHSQVSSIADSELEDEFNHLVLKGDEDDQDLLTRTPSRDSSKSAKTIKPMSEDEKLKAIQAEFGVNKLITAYVGEERMLASETCVLYRRILIRGYATLTNHRFCFIAYLPSEPHDAHQDQNSAKVILQSPATLHRPGFTKRNRKAWFVLTRHAITAYHSSDDLYEPLGSIRLADISNVSPAKHHSKHSVCFKVKNQSMYLEFESEEGVSAWVKELDLARWRLAHNVDKVRVSIPLVRLINVRPEPYLQAMTLLHMDVLVDNLYLQSGAHRLENLQRLQHRDKDNTKVQHTTEIVFAMKTGESEIANIIEESLVRSRNYRNSQAKQDWWSLPVPILEIEGPAAWQDDKESEQDDLHARRSTQRKLLDEFSLNCRIEDIHPVKCELVRTIPSMGIMALTPDYLCFYRRRRFTGLSDTRIKIPIEHLKTAIAAKAFRWHHFGLRVQIQAHEDLQFEFHQPQFRDKAVELLEAAIEAARKRKLDHSLRSNKKKTSLTSQGRALASQANSATITLPIHAISQVPRAANITSAYRPIRIDPIKIICLTIGSRGDVQPYIALCKELQRHKHECIIVSHPEYEDWVRSFNIDFRPAGGDPGALMKLSVENKMYSPTFFKEAISKFKHWLDELLRDIMTSCWDAELIIESPSTFGGIHVAEAVGCYYMRAFTMPWTKTSAYPQAFSVPSVDMGPQYNAMSYTMFDQLLWTASSGQINRWRKHMLNLGPTSMAKMHTETVPFMYNFSPAVVPPPLDWGSLTAVTGYWTLQSNDDTKFDPPQDLVDFIAKAKKDDKKLAYIGFGSITIADPRGTQKAIYEAVQKSDVRAIVSKGWSERMKEKAEDGKEEEPLVIPEEVYAVDSIPHDWLFPQIHIAMHHGGAGTTGASLKAGLVTLIHPFFGDQYFWSGRVDKLGAGIRVKNLKTDTIAEALTRAKSDRIMKEKAEVVGDALRKEHGVYNAVNFIYMNLSKAKRKKRVRVDRRRSTTSSIEDGNSSAAPVTSDEEGFESEDAENGDEGKKIKESLGNHSPTHSSYSLLTYSGLKQASIHPIDALHLTRKTSNKTKTSPTKTSPSIEKTLSNLDIDSKQTSPKEITSGQLSQSPSRMTTFSSSEEVASPLDKDEEIAAVLDPDETPLAEHRKGSIFGLQYMPSIQRQFSFHYPSVSQVMKLGLGHADHKDINGNGKEQEVMTEEEIKKRQEENKQKHRSAKEEDQRRRRELIGAWKRAKRMDLIAGVVEEEMEGEEGKEERGDDIDGDEEEDEE